jgi:diguanylate cyclase (GGDEF)-like protein
MRFKNSKFIIATGFTAVLCIVLVVSAIGIYRLNQIKDTIRYISEVDNTKREVINHMHSIISHRSLSMYAMMIMKDDFERDDMYMQYNQLAAEFVQERDKLLQLDLSEQEKFLLDRALEIIRLAQPVQEAIVEDILAGESGKIPNRILTEDLPLETSVIYIFDAILQIANEKTRIALEEADLSHQRTLTIMLTLNGITVLIGALIAIIVIRRTTQIEDALHKEKEQAVVTLHAIGDGVITTDAQGNINYISPVASQLVEWQLAEAYQHPLETVFRIKDEDTNLLVPLKPLLEQSMQRPIQFHNRTLLLTKSDRKLSIEGSASPIRNQSNKTVGVVIVFRDVTHSRQLADKLSWQATHDALTGLANRSEFERNLEMFIHSAKELKIEHAVLYIDLDQFKVVNDTCGHIAGDELLKQLTGIVQKAIRTSDILARLGGDEFGLLLEGCPLPKAERIANQLLKTIQEFRYTWNDSVFKIGASIGIVKIDEHCNGTTEVMSAADAACYVAKDKGRNRIWVHDVTDEEINLRHGEMEVLSRINQALEEGRFRLYKQLIMPLNRTPAKGSHYEVLIRMLDGSDEILLPMAFIPAAERYGVMTRIDTWVINNIFDKLASHNPELSDAGMIAINLSGLSLCDEEFLNFVVNKLHETEIDPEVICFEITETAAIANWLRATRFISILKGMGCRFALDDFGSGMSSFSYLQHLTVDYIKIDGTFVRNIVDDEINFTMVEAIHRVADVMGVQTIAEFVENDGILQRLREIGIDFAQGHGIHKPVPIGNDIDGGFIYTQSSSGA